MPSRSPRSISIVRLAVPALAPITRAPTIATFSLEVLKFSSAPSRSASAALLCSCEMGQLPARRSQSVALRSPAKCLATRNSGATLHAPSRRPRPPRVQTASPWIPPTTRISRPREIALDLYRQHQDLRKQHPASSASDRCLERNRNHVRAFSAVHYPLSEITTSASRNVIVKSGSPGFTASIQGQSQPNSNHDFRLGRIDSSALLKTYN